MIGIVFVFNSSAPLKLRDEVHASLWVYHVVIHTRPGGLFVLLLQTDGWTDRHQMPGYVMNFVDQRGQQTWRWEYCRGWITVDTKKEWNITNINAAKITVADNDQARIMHQTNRQLTISYMLARIIWFISRQQNHRLVKLLTTDKFWFISNMSEKTRFHSHIYCLLHLQCLITGFNTLNTGECYNVKFHSKMNIMCSTITFWTSSNAIGC